MFQSFEFAVDDNNLRIIEIDLYDQSKIIDSEFEEDCWGVGVMSSYDLIEEVIDIYERRNLNVAANLAKAVIWLIKEGHGVNGGNDPIELIERLKDDYLQFAKYEKDLIKYLMLM